MTEKESRITGFLDGYKAQNIASATTSLQFHWDEIERLLEDMVHAPPGQSEDKEAHVSFQRLADYLSRIKDDDTIEKSMKFGEATKTLVQEAGEARNEILMDKNFRRIAFQFLELAEIGGDKQVVDIAVELGEYFSE